MTQNDFNWNLDDLPGTPPRDPRMIAWEIFVRDQWRTRILAALSIFFWLIGLAGMFLLIIGLDQLVIFIRIADWDHAELLRSMLETIAMAYLGTMVALVFAAPLPVLNVKHSAHDR